MSIRLYLIFQFISKKLLDLTIAPSSPIETKSIHKVIESVARNKNSQNLAWKWLRSNWDQVNGQYGEDSFSFIGNSLTASTANFNTKSELKELEDFYKEHLNKLGSGKRATENAIQKTKGNIEWMQNHYQPIVDWLSKKNRDANVY